MNKRSIRISVAVVGVLAFSTTLAVLQVVDDRRDRRDAFERGRAAGTCSMVRDIYPDPETRTPEAAEMIGWCKAWDARLKP